MASRSFRPITDLLQIVTNLPASDIGSESYHLTMAINQSSCRTGGGGSALKISLLCLLTLTAP